MRLGSPIIYIDVDDVLADFTAAFLDRVNKANGTRFSAADHKDYNFSCVIPEGDRWERYIPDVDFWATLPLHPWAEDLMQAVWKTGLPYAFLSGIPFGNAFDGRKIWLDSHFDNGGKFRPHERLVLALEKQFVVTAKDILIEDSPRQIAACRSLGATVLAITHPWNQEVQDTHPGHEIAGLLPEACRRAITLFSH